MARKKVTRTAQGLTDVLFDELEALRNGDSDPQKAKATCGLANSICAVARLELEYQSRDGMPAPKVLKIGRAKA